MIQLENINKVYQQGKADVHALRGVSLEINSGEFVALVGASGSGKSTVINILGCLDRPTSGRYWLRALDVSTLGPDALAEIRNQKIGIVFENSNLVPGNSTLENVRLPLHYRHPRRLTTREQRAVALRALEVVGLAESADLLPDQLSAGQQQRAAIARALVGEPELLLADEPTGNLDSRARLELLGVFQELNRRGITVVVVTQEPDVARHARRQLSLRDGRIVGDTSVLEPVDAEFELRSIARGEAPETAMPLIA